MNFYESCAALAQDKMEETVEAQYQDSLKTTKDADGGPFPAYTSEKSWDEAFYHNVISGADFAAHPYFVTTVIHDCKGGLESDENSALMVTDCQPIPGLYAAGEAAGRVLLRSSGRTHGMKYVSGGKVIPTCSRERTSQRILTTWPSSSTIARGVWRQMRTRPCWARIDSQLQAFTSQVKLPEVCSVYGRVAGCTTRIRRLHCTA